MASSHHLTRKDDLLGEQLNCGLGRVLQALHGLEPGLFLLGRSRLGCQGYERNITVRFHIFRDMIMHTITGYLIINDPKHISTILIPPVGGSLQKTENRCLAFKLTNSKKENVSDNDTQNYMAWVINIPTDIRTSLPTFDLIWQQPVKQVIAYGYCCSATNPSVFIHFCTFM